MTQTIELGDHSSVHISVEFGGAEGEVVIAFLCPQEVMACPGYETRLLMRYEHVERLYKELKPYFTPPKVARARGESR